MTGIIAPNIGIFGKNCIFVGNENHNGMYRRFFLAAVLTALFWTCASADTPFRNHRYDAMNIMPVQKGDVVFVGNSITNMHEWWEAFGGRNNILNRGVSGCVSSETLQNIDPIVEGHPSKVFIMIGTNDIVRLPSEQRQPDVVLEVVSNVQEIVSRFRQRSPETELYIQSILPVSEDNRRSAETIVRINGLYREMCEREGITYVDLWSLMVEPGTTHINPAYTRDGLHLYPSGYRVWCNAVAPFIGAECIYEDVPNNDFGLEGSFAMRAAAFSLSPLDSDDIVMVGDEMIHGGEWHELLDSPRVKNRGTGWGFGGPSMEDIGKEIPAIFASGDAPYAVCLHAGAAEVAANVPADTIEARYRALVSTIVNAAPESRLLLMSVQPVYQFHHKTTSQKDVNSRIAAIAGEFGAEYVDIYTPLREEKNVSGYLNGNYVMGEGYLKISRILSERLSLDKVPSLFVTRETAFTGRGNRGEVLSTLTISPEKKLRLRRMKVALDGVASDVTSLSVRCGGRVLGSVKVKPGKTEYRIPCRLRLTDLTDIELCADISEDAAEGNVVSADIRSVKCGLFRWLDVAVPEHGGREILLRRVKLLGTGDYGSVGYRIPAIVTLPDGSLLVTADKRKDNDLDLPEDIDIIAQRSADGGATWSDPVTVIEGKGFNKGYGDAALLVTGSGDVLCAFSGGTGLWASTLENPQRNYICRSTDGGITWSEPEDCTFRLWGPKADNPECRSCHSAFFASGRGLTLEKGPYAGRVMFVAAVHSSINNRFDNYIYYSDDEGANWKVSKCAFIGGDEAKVVELPDGKVLLSVRRSGERGFNVSEDGGVTWKDQGTWKDICVNACDGDIIPLGDSLLLHSVPNSMERRNVSIFVSRDNGRTWPYSKRICSYESVYSSMTVLPDGTVGVYLEENPEVEFDMYYLNFSADWLLKP